MGANTHATPESNAEVNRWLSQLLASTGKLRQEAATQLSRLGVWTRGHVRTRGELSEAAANRLPEPKKLDDLIACLNDEDKEVRCHVALALGEWGDARAAAGLCRLLQDDVDENVQLYCITALRLIGGPVAAEGLVNAIESGSDAVRNAALTAVEELASGPKREDTEGPDESRGVVLMKGGAKASSRSRESVASITDALQRVRADDTASAFLRRKANEVLGRLQT